MAGRAVASNDGQRTRDSQSSGAERCCNGCLRVCGAVTALFSFPLLVAVSPLSPSLCCTHIDAMRGEVRLGADITVQLLWAEWDCLKSASSLVCVDGWFDGSDDSDHISVSACVLAVVALSCVRLEI